MFATMIRAPCRQHRFTCKRRGMLPFDVVPKAACHTPVPLQRLLAKSVRNSNRSFVLFQVLPYRWGTSRWLVHCYKTGYFPDLRLFCACARGTNSSNNEMKFKHWWTNNFIQIFDLFVSPLNPTVYIINNSGWYSVCAMHLVRQIGRDFQIKNIPN